MRMRRFRGIVAALSLALAILSCGAALALSAPQTHPASGQARIAGETEYLLADRDGEVCIYADGTLLSNTGIPVRSLPRRDREELAQGISARGERELAALLEDFGA